MPKGGGAVRGIGEKFSVNPVTGTASLSVPLPVAPGRAGFGPQLSLDYDSGNGNGAFGLGWTLSLPAITRKTDKGLPRYHDDEESDVFILAGAEDLVPVLTAAGARWTTERTDAEGHSFTVHRYRPRTEGLFARIERWRQQDTGEVHWRSISRENVTTIYGRTAAARITDPADPARVYSWLIEESTSDRGEIIAYEYAPENGDGVDPTLPHESARIARGHAFANRYLTCVRYANRTPGVRGDWLFSLVLDYATPGANDPEACNDRPWPVRADAFSTYRAGFELRTWRLCRRALVFHHFPTPALPRSPYLVRALELEYDETPVAAYLTRITQRGYRWDPATGSYVDRALPPLELSYGSRALSEEVRIVTREALAGLPAGLADPKQHWVDLDGEGIAGALSVDGGWYYSRNLGTV
ncbi:MAG TPA: SpvB/TcaC N-terminal domain-containing protein, partial [Gemmatimonadaceae bacterium]|nr:SpvB/TcaC N-terminal domain-containing protein [Gemmatimonadaceae bacterium]